MKYLRIVLPLFIGTLVYSLLGFSLGPKGYWPYTQLEQEKSRLERNLEALQVTNALLEANLANLTSDPDTIAVYAHEMGYVHDGEQLIKLAGFTGGIDRKLVPGNVIESKKPDFIPDWIGKLVGILTGAIVFFGLDLLLRKQEVSYKKRSTRFV